MSGEHRHPGQRIYKTRDDAEATPPNHPVRSLSDYDLEEEILADRGDAAWMLALIKEHDRRAREAT